jgi:SAM-dependent methyltransferase
MADAQQTDYDVETPLYLKHGMRLLQAGLVDDDEAKTLQLIERLLAPEDHWEILDCGCGIGAVAQGLVARNPTLRLTCLTNSKVQYRAVESYADSRLRPVLADLAATGLPDASYDAVMFIESFGYGEPDAVFSEAWRVLRTGGVLFLKEMGALGSLDAQGEADLQIARQVWGYRHDTSDSIVSDAVRNGFVVDKVTDPLPVSFARFLDFVYSEPFMWRKYGVPTATSPLQAFSIRFLKAEKRADAATPAERPLLPSDQLEGAGAAAERQSGRAPLVPDSAADPAAAETSVAPRVSAVIAPLAATLEPIWPYLPRQLVSEACIQTIQSTTRGLPGTLSTTFLFETRLGDPAAWVDFGWRIDRSSLGHRILAGQSAESLPERFLRRASWTRLSDFARRWADASSSLHERVSDIWLELDLAGRGARAAIPSVYCGAGGWLPDELALLRGRELSAEVVARVAACQEALPPGGGVFQVGVMLSRAEDGVRLILRGIPPLALPDYLERSGWGQAPAGLATLLDIAAGFALHPNLCLDVGRTFGRTIGLECSAHRIGPNAPARWPELLDGLVRRGLCRPEKAVALLEWASLARGTLCIGEWPEHLRSAASPPLAGEQPAVYRNLSHLKLVCYTDGRLEAKAYLAAHYVWMQTDGGWRTRVL